MTTKFILLTTIATVSLSSKAQTLNDMWNTTKQTVVTNSNTVIDAAKTNTTVNKAVTNTNNVLSTPIATTVIGAASGTKAGNVINTTQTILGGSTTGAGTTGGISLTNDEVIKGLKEALSVGTNNSSASAAKTDGFLKNALLYIPWPAEAQEMKTKLIQLGYQKKVTEFETSLNRAAEEAAKKAAPVFVNAITGMTISDGFAILKGNDTAATHYLREKTFTPLKAQFSPVVKDAITKVKVTSYWTPLVTIYNKIPGVKKQNPDLNDYVCNKAVNGLMILIANEEVKIRKDPMARVTDILKKVFGSKK